jgi:putative mycofactocin binding protein MftB
MPSPARPACEFDPGKPARLSPEVSLRDEDFGALAYHFGTRRLVFLKSTTLVELLRGLGAHHSARAALEAHVAPGEHEHYLAALSRLFDAGVVDAA